MFTFCWENKFLIGQLTKKFSVKPGFEELKKSKPTWRPIFWSFGSYPPKDKRRKYQMNGTILTHALQDDSVWANIKHLDWKTVVFCLLPSMKVKDLKGQYIFERPLNQPYRPKPLKLWDLIVRDRSMLLHFGLCKGPPTRPLTLWTSFSLFLLKRKLELY